MKIEDGYGIGKDGYSLGRDGWDGIITTDGCDL